MIRRLLYCWIALTGSIAGAENPVAAGVTVVEVPATKGVVAWEDVAVAIADASQYDGDALRGLLPRGELNLNQRKVRWSIVGTNLLLPDGLTLSTARTGDDRLLRITIDHAELRESLHDWESKARLLSGGINSTQGCELVLDDEWEPRCVSRELVILIHGYNSRARSLSEIHEELRGVGLGCGVYSYPNDGPIANAGRNLSRLLKRLRVSHPDLRIAIVAHSMGGLVARAAIENPELDPGNVARLIMVATPNHGSTLASLPVGLDAWEHFGRSDDEGEQFLTQFLSDGLGEGRSDLQPDSTLLTELNARPRNPAVTYSILLGDAGFLSDAECEKLRGRWDSLTDRSRIAKLMHPRVAPVLVGDELCERRGDGVVSVKSGKLEGVTDIVVLPFRHYVMTHAMSSPEGEQLLAFVLQRLGVKENSADAGEPTTTESAAVLDPIDTPVP
jgi:pimeloyl-ACP methyl ester carboxylesterase